jgi:hypothetical protein
MDITYVPMARGFIYLAVVLDWYSRRVLSWRLSITMEASFCIAALEDALARYGKPEIFNTDQGSQFTGAVGIPIRGQDIRCNDIVCFGRARSHAEAMQKNAGRAGRAPLEMIPLCRSFECLF